MRALAYFAGWLLAVPGLLFAVAVLALDRVIALGNPFAILWEAAAAFAYGLPVAALVTIGVCILGCFRMGRLVGAGALLVTCLGSLALILESEASPRDFEEALSLAPTIAAAVRAGWLLRAESRNAPQAAGRNLESR